MLSSKEAFLNNIASRLGRKRITATESVRKPIWHTHPWDDLYTDYTQQDLAGLFEQELNKLGGQVIHVQEDNQLQLEKAIGTWLEQYTSHSSSHHDSQNRTIQADANAKKSDTESGQENGHLPRIVAWPDESPEGSRLRNTMQRFTERGLASAHILPVGNRNQSSAPVDAVTITGEQLQKVEQADIGFVIAEHGLAETGTCVLYNGGPRGRLVSLLPTVCAIVLRASSILPRLTQLLPHLQQRAADSTCMNLITGPSRSADIEMSLSVGVHGPGEVAVFLIDDLT